MLFGKVTYAPEELETLGSLPHIGPLKTYKKRDQKLVPLFFSMAFCGFTKLREVGFRAAQAATYPEV